MNQTMESLSARSLDNTPAAPPPPGVIPNLINPQNLSVASNATVITCLVATTIFVWLRVYTKLRIYKSHGYEDYASFIAWSGFVAYCAIQFQSSRYSNGNHIWDTRIVNEAPFLKYANDLEICYGPLIFITKLSILVQYIQIFVTTHRNAVYYTIITVIWSNALFYMADTLVEIFLCVPRSKIWDPTVPGRCVDANIAFVATAAVNVVSDFSILLLPQGCIWQLQMPTKRKLIICAVFAAGLLGCMASIMRLVISIQKLYSEDPNHDLLPVLFWSDAEIACGIICGCLPVLPRFFRHFGPMVASKMSTARPSHSRSHASVKVGKKSYRGQASSWHEPYDPRLPQGDYLELGERDRGLGPSTIVVGGKEAGQPV